MDISISLSQPDLTDAEVHEVAAVLRSGHLHHGPRVALFEQLVADRCGRRHAVAVNTSLAAMHLALLALGVGEGDEVITSPLGCISAANSIVMTGATPVFVDIDPVSLNLDPQQVAAAITPRTRAIIASQLLGNTAHVDRLEVLANKHEIPMIENACASLGGQCHQRPAGGFGRVSIFACHPDKQITTGDGGVVATDDDRLADLCRSLRDQGRSLAPDDEQQVVLQGHGATVHVYERMGFQYQLSELHAALGVVQMRRLEEILEKRRAVAGLYMERLMDWDSLMLPTLLEGREKDMAWHVFAVRLTHSYNRQSRDRIVTGMRRHEIAADTFPPCIHLQPCYRALLGLDEGDFPLAESAADRLMLLPFHHRLDDTQIELICHTLKIMIDRENLLRRDH